MTTGREPATDQAEDDARTAEQERAKARESRDINESPSSGDEFLSGDSR